MLRNKYPVITHIMGTNNKLIFMRDDNSRVEFVPTEEEWNFLTDWLCHSIMGKWNYPLKWECVPLCSRVSGFIAYRVANQMLDIGKV